MPDVDRLAGTLLGTALGDALGLAAEGMSGPAIARRFGRVERFHLLGRTGFVSDDTEQSALIAQSLARHPDDPVACARAFRRSLLGWFARLPFGVGLGTVRACLKIGLGFRETGVDSAGNGAAMRAAIVGVFFADRPDDRERFGRALAETTHRDPRAVAGALYVADLAAACARAPIGTPPGACVEEARRRVAEPAVAGAVDRAVELADRGADMAEAAGTLGTSGFVIHGVGIATFGFLRFGHEPMSALAETIGAGGDTDSNAAILGGWLGALHGETALPRPLLDRIQRGPFGPPHLRALAGRLAAGSGPIPGYSAALAMSRNLALYPVVLAHGFRRLVPL